MAQKDHLSSTLSIDEYESIVSIPLFSYLIVLDDKWNLQFSFSFDFESPEQCETFGFHYNKGNVVREFELNFILDLIQKHLLRMSQKQVTENSHFIDLDLSPQYVCLLKIHESYLIAIYSEKDTKFSPTKREFIHGSLRGIASAFVASFYSNEGYQSHITDGTIDSFLNAIPLILSQTSTENNNRNCFLCPPDKFCFPKLLLKKFS